MSHASRDANLLGAAALAVADRLAAAPRDAALLALDDWLAGASVDALARVVALTHSGAVRLADRLAADGLLERRRRDDDARAVALHLTPAGAAEAARLRAAREATLSGLLAPVADRGAFVAELEAVLAAITRAGAAPVRTCRICDAHACGHPDTCPVTRAAHG